MMESEMGLLPYSSADDNNRRRQFRESTSQSAAMALTVAERRAWDDRIAAARVEAMEAGRAAISGGLDCPERGMYVMFYGDGSRESAAVRGVGGAVLAGEFPPPGVVELVGRTRNRQVSTNLPRETIEAALAAWLMAEKSASLCGDYGSPEHRSALEAEIVDECRERGLDRAVYDQVVAWIEGLDPV